MLFLSCATSPLITPTLIPSASITGPATGGVGEEVRFISADLAPSNARHAWTTGDGGTGTGTVLRHTYAEAGAYTVTLEVNDPTCAGSPACSKSAAHQIVITGDSEPPDDPGDPPPGDCEPCPLSSICMEVSGIEDSRKAPHIAVGPDGLFSTGGPAVFQSICDPPFEPSRGGVLIAGRFEFHGGPTDGDPPWWGRSRTAPITTSLGRFQGSAWVDELQCGVYDGRTINCHWWLVCSAATRQPYEALISDQVTGLSQIASHAGGEPGAVYENLGAFPEPDCATLRGVGSRDDAWKAYRESQ